MTTQVSGQSTKAPILWTQAVKLKFTASTRCGPPHSKLLCHCAAERVAPASRSTSNRGEQSVPSNLYYRSCRPLSSSPPYSSISLKHCRRKMRNLTPRVQLMRASNTLLAARGRLQLLPLLAHSPLAKRSFHASQRVLEIKPFLLADIGEGKCGIP